MKIDDIKKIKLNLSIGYDGLMCLINDDEEYIKELVDYIKYCASSMLEMQIGVDMEIAYDT